MTSRTTKNITELIGIGAVVIGLLFVWYELRQNQLGLQAQARASLAQIDIESIRSVREDEELLRALSERYGSTVEEQRFSFWIREQTRTAEHHFYQFRIGSIDQEEFNGMVAMWKVLFSTQEYRDWWATHKSGFSTAFQREFDELLEDR